MSPATLDRLSHGYFAAFLILGWLLPNHIASARFITAIVWVGLIIVSLMRHQHSRRVRHRFHKFIAIGTGSILPLIVAAMLYSEGLLLLDDWQNGDYRQPRAELLHAAFTIPAKEQCDANAQSNTCWFPADGYRLHCSQTSSDTCQRAYAYAGQQAQAWHYDGRIYELRVGEQVIYDYAAQIAAFEKARHNLRRGILELLFFVALPQLWLAWQYWRLGKMMPEESDDAPQYRTIPRKGSSTPARRNRLFIPALKPAIRAFKILAGLALLLLTLSLASKPDIWTFSGGVILVAELLAVVPGDGNGYWRYHAARQSIERVRRQYFRWRVEETQPLADWQAVATVQTAEDMWTVCLIGHDGVTTRELERFGVLAGGRTYARKYRKQISKATGLAEWEEQ